MSRTVTVVGNGKPRAPRMVTEGLAPTPKHIVPIGLHGNWRTEPARYRKSMSVIDVITVCAFDLITCF